MRPKSSTSRWGGRASQGAELAPPPPGPAKAPPRGWEVDGGGVAARELCRCKPGAVLFLTPSVAFIKV